MRKSKIWDKRLDPHDETRFPPETPPRKRSERVRQDVKRWYHIVAWQIIYAARAVVLRRAKDEDLRIDDLISYLNRDTFFFTQGLAANINQCPECCA